MLFNSLNFAVFLPIALLLYWFFVSKNLKYQNFLLLVSSYFFYSCWDYRFLALLLFSTSLDYFTGIKIHEALLKKQKLFWLWLSIFVNLGFLGIFKYYNFFASSFAELLSEIGLKSNLPLLSLILPVGISFYTFHGLSYIIDIYKDRIPPERSFIDYAVFVSFFPLLIAGPIERATHLLPQIKRKRTFVYANFINGLEQILWGLFKKMVIADNCAVYANQIFNDSTAYSGSTLVLGAVFFSFQIYGDFSGYSDIALGVAKLFGIDLLRNFASPYFSRDIAEFWRRWHISLSSWFKDYVYIPLGGSKGSKWVQIRNIFIIFLLSGFWHGANYTFLFWGFLNAVYFLPLFIFKTNRNHIEIAAKNSFLPSMREFFQMLLTFCLVTFAWIFFRAPNLEHAFNYIQGIFSPTLFSIPEIKPAVTLAVLLVFIGMEWIGRKNEFAISRMFQKNSFALRMAFYYALIFAILYLNGNNQQFIYFQF